MLIKEEPEQKSEIGCAFNEAIDSIRRIETGIGAGCPAFGIMIEIGGVLL